MKPQHSNKVMSSAMLWLDNKICTKGEAYFNTNGYFYPTENLYNGYYTYAAQHSQLIADSSISGATIMTGVYLDNSFIGKGQGGLFDIDYEHGRLYFTGEITGINRISGSYSVKEVDVKLIFDAEEKVLVEKKQFYKPRITQSPTGINTDETTYPIIFLKEITSKNEPMAFGGLQTTKQTIQATILADSQFQLDAIRSIIRDTKETYIPLFSQNEYPFNGYGGLISGIYNYTGMTNNRTSMSNSAFVSDTYNSTFTQKIEAGADKFNPNVWMGISEIDVDVYRTPNTEVLT